ncbi:helix-turn-helix domain-containing protein [Promicromonospora iranensis]|uniref:Excisionase family DNA binding protein n=1 Tax=Promicromonospora iranensis TaxID=1105144 RepID=A0ABU2CV76_9MICO|nr:helix-turn-helix domain-containing protein [Promicromonospora iranensis]MDR7385249.1 excisionase family DNA binding protein [Promicromonospora iranensis]
MTKPATAAVLERYVTVADVAEALGCSDDHVRGLLADGALPYIDISRRGAKTRRPKIRVPIAAVERYAEKQLRQGAA